VSIADDRQHRARFLSRVQAAIETIEDLRIEVGVAQTRRPAAPVGIYLSWADFHLSEAQDELKRARARVQLI
jgi:hypothetical protein